MALTQTLLWINGEKRFASDRAMFEVYNPLTGGVVGKCASASSQDCKDAVEAASRAFPAWEKTPATAKRMIFLKAAGLLQTEKYKTKTIQAYKDETSSKDWGIANLMGSIFGLTEAASLATQIKGESYPSQAPGGYVIVQRRAHGVVLSIAPWNAPLTLAARAVAVPLICGNTVVLKSSEYSPRIHEILVEVMHEAGLPPGVLNFVSMSRQSSPNLVSELISNPAVRHINFTGSDRVGRIIAGEAAKYLKPCVFELGGKAPAVVLNDADIDAAARAITEGAMMHSGQICMSTERVIVQRGIAEAFTTQLISVVSKLKAGDVTTNSDTKLPPLFTEGSAQNVLNFMNEAREQGAEVLLGDLTRKGAVIQPHLVKGVKPGMALWDRESFGPVAGIVVVDTIDEAIDLANTSEYTLTASVWTRDINRALDVASRIRAGSTAINGSTFHAEPGLGHAGLGGATGYGRFDIEHFTVKRTLIINPADRTYPFVDDN